MKISVKFLGAAETVTGSKYLVQLGDRRLLVDCGIFQGETEWKERNWHNFESISGVSPLQIEAVLLTHAHVDHVGYLPRLYSQGCQAPVYTTRPSIELSTLILNDFAKIQEEDANFRSYKNISSHHPPLPFCTATDVAKTLTFLREVPFEKQVEIFPNVMVTWRRMGHILGAASITIEANGKMITFSGDIGRYNVPILVDPQPAPLGDLLLIESTYGDRLHPKEPPAELLGSVVSRTAARGGVTIIPSFAVGRTQLILYYLRELKSKGKIPDIPIIVDSPMALDATEIYKDNPQCYDSEALVLANHGHGPFHPSKLYFTKDSYESKQLNKISEPMVIIAGSGMVTGGRVQHHLYHKISSPLNTVLFVGYQSKGTKGAWIKSGASTVRLFKEEIPVRAEVSEISGLSAHGDRDEMLRWCQESYRKFGKIPSKVAFIHGEIESTKAFRKTVESSFGWKGILPKYLETIEV